MSDLDRLFDALAERLADRILSKIGGQTASVFTTAKRGPHIPGKSRAWMLRNVKTMPGAKRIGRDWVISDEDFRRWATAMDASRMRAQSRAPTDVEELADSFLADAGWRGTKKSKAA